MLSFVARVALYASLFTVMPVASSAGAAPRVTVAVMPDEQVVPVTVPFAQ